MTACKWVSECIADTPYYVDEALVDKFKCDFYLHGDDPCFSADGINICDELDKVGKFKVFKRTSGISTTSITGKLLRLQESEEERKERPIDPPK
jgi:ethanolamine-phosphate cytidylyltransferase